MCFLLLHVFFGKTYPDCFRRTQHLWHSTISDDSHSHLEPDQSRETNRRLPGDGWTWPSLINNWVVLRVDDQSLPRVKQTFYLGLWRIFKYEMFGDKNVESFNWYDNRISLLNISIFIRRKSQACKCLYSNGDDGPNDGESVDLGLLYRNS